MNAWRETTPHKRPSHWTNILGGIEKKCSGENILGLRGIRPSYWTNMQNTLGYKNILGLTCSGVVVQLKRGSYATISDEFTT